MFGFSTFAALGKGTPALKKFDKEIEGWLPSFDYFFASVD